MDRRKESRENIVIGLDKESPDKGRLYKDLPEYSGGAPDYLGTAS